MVFETHFDECNDFWQNMEFWQNLMVFSEKKSDGKGLVVK